MPGFQVLNNSGEFNINEQDEIVVSIDASINDEGIKYIRTKMDSYDEIFVVYPKWVETKKVIFNSTDKVDTFDITYNPSE